MEEPNFRMMRVKEAIANTIIIMGVVVIYVLSNMAIFLLLWDGVEGAFVAATYSIISTFFYLCFMGKCHDWFHACDDGILCICYGVFLAILVFAGTGIFLGISAGALNGIDYPSLFMAIIGIFIYCFGMALIIWAIGDETTYPVWQLYQNWQYDHREQEY